MNNRDLTDRLYELTQLEIDLILAYNQAVGVIKRKSLHDVVLDFRFQTERHVADLGRVIKNHGGTPPELSHDFLSFYAPEIHPVTNEQTDLGAILVLRANEKTALERCQALLRQVYSADAITCLSELEAQARRRLSLLDTLASEQYGVMSTLQVSTRRSA